MTSTPCQSSASRPPVRRYVGILTGLAVFAVMLGLSPPGAMPVAAWRVAAVAVLMAVWWVTEALPVPATALVPLAAFPLTGVMPMTDAAAPYAHPLIFLFLGGFLIALAMERWNLHRRIALSVLTRVGTRPAALVGGFMVGAAGLSMWVSNTATTVMMLPIALSVIGLLRGEDVGDMSADEDRNFALTLLLGIAYGASIGGLGTLIGTPPNALLAAYLDKTYGIAVGFGQWMLVGIPLVVVMLPAAWIVLTRFAYPVARRPIAGAQSVIAGELKALGRLSREEACVAAVFAATALLWMLRPVLNDALPGLTLSDPMIALVGALFLFVIPADLRQGVFLLDWEMAKRLPWGVLILFGGGLSLASAIDGSGLAAWISEALAAGSGWPLVVLVATVAAVVLLLTEITSNTATASVFLPLAGSLAVSIAVDPFVLLVPVALAASCAFMMPVATPPNAIIFGSGYITIPEMARAGLALNVLAVVAIVGATYSLVLWVFGVDLGILPAWATTGTG